jgi:ataxin-3
MVLTQAEAEGYSVFVVRKAGAGAGESAGPDPGEAAGWGDGGVGVLPEAGADLMAAHLGEVVNRRGSGGSLPPPMYAGPSNGNGAGREYDNSDSR